MTIPLKLQRKRGPKPVPVAPEKRRHGPKPFPPYISVLRKSGKLLRVDPQIFEWRRKRRAAQAKLAKEEEKQKRIEEETVQRGKIWKLFE